MKAKFLEVAALLLSAITVSATTTTTEKWLPVGTISANGLTSQIVFPLLDDIQTQVQVARAQIPASRSARSEWTDAAYYRTQLHRLG